MYGIFLIPFMIFILGCTFWDPRCASDRPESNAEAESKPQEDQDIWDILDPRH
jgi:hypothetical protein